MNLFPKILKNTIIQIIGKVLSVLLGIASISLITRSLGPESYGHYTTILNYLLIVGVIIDGGLHLTMIQLVSRKKELIKKEEIIHNILSLRLVSAVVTLIIASIVAWFLPYPMVVKLGILIISFTTLFNGIIQILTGIFQIKLHMTKVIIAEIFRFLVYLILLLSIFFLKISNIYWILVAMVIAYLVNLLLLIIFSRQYFKIKLTWNKTVIKEILLYAWPLALSVLFNLMYLRTDVLILSLIKPAEDVGFYGLGYKFIDILAMMAPLLMGIVLPILTNAWHQKDMKDFQYYFQQSFNLFTIFAFPVVVGVQFVAPQLITWIAGTEFIAAANILRILIFAIIALFIGGLSGYAIVAINKQKTMMWGYAGTAVLSLIAYLIFIPIYGYWAAAYITIFSEFTILFLTYWIVLKTTKINLNLTVLLKTILASTCMGGVLYFLNIYSLILNVLIGGFIYFSMLILLKAISINTIKNWRQIAGK